MSLCVHGYSAFWDCPLCECHGCGRTQDACVCHLSPAPTFHGAAGQVVVPAADDSIEVSPEHPGALSNLPHDA